MKRVRYLCIFIWLAGGPLITNGDSCGAKGLAKPQLVNIYSGGNLVFALDLYKQASVKMMNAFISPFSVSVALAMTAVGAGGNTLKQMKDILNLNGFLTETDNHEAVFSVLDSFCPSTNYTLATANKIFVQMDFAVKKQFQLILSNFYKSAAESVDFITNANLVTKNINKWVEEQTQSHIKNLIEPQILNHLTKLVLVNAIYFNGNWVHQFQKDGTKSQNFILDNGKVKSTPMMYLDEQYLFYTQSNQLPVQIVELPYKGDRLVMYVILPSLMDGITKLKGKLTPYMFKALREEMKSTKVIVKLPKFKIDAKFKLSKILLKMGMPDLFSMTEANLTRVADLNGNNLYVTHVIHQAFVQVDEKGTTAAAATAVVLGIGFGIGASDPIRFIADHPFIFVIFDKLTNLILFIGNVDNPIV